MQSSSEMVIGSYVLGDQVVNFLWLLSSRTIRITVILKIGRNASFCLDGAGPHVRNVLIYRISGKGKNRVL